LRLPGSDTNSGLTGKLLLYVAPGTANSALAERNLWAVMQELDDKGVGLGLEIVNVLTSPERAAVDGVLVTPTLIGLMDSRQLIMIGDLTDTAKLRLTLQSLQDAQTIKKMKAQVVAQDQLLITSATMTEELNHRVRNNLHLVQAMLNNHLLMVSSPAEKASVDAIIRCVVTIAALYDHLLGTGMSRTINLGNYITSLCQTLPGLQLDRNKDVKLVCAVEPLLVDLDSVTVIGLVIAESVSNSYKHAFAAGVGNIDVILQRSEETADQAILTVRDNGPGFVERPGSRRHGLGLLHRLMQKVNGTADLRVDQGTVWTFRFAVASQMSCGS
jgi:two-component sensor histidine kinase